MLIKILIALAVIVILFVIFGDGSGGEKLARDFRSL